MDKLSPDLTVSVCQLMNEVVVSDAILVVVTIFNGISTTCSCLWESAGSFDGVMAENSNKEQPRVPIAKAWLRGKPFTCFFILTFLIKSKGFISSLMFYCIFIIRRRIYTRMRLIYHP